MSTPPDMLARLQAQQKPPPQPGGGTPGPAGTPMAGPTKKEGSKEIAKVQVHIAMNMLEQALAAFGSESKEGKSILRNLNGLSKDFGDSDAGDLIPAQILEMAKGTPQMGGGNEMQQQLMKMMKQGAAPGGAPGGGMPQPAIA